MRAVVDRSARTLADVLADAAAPSDLVDPNDPVDPPEPVDAADPADPADRSGPADRDDAPVAALRSLLDGAARAATPIGGWTPDDPLRLSKSAVTWLLRCPRRALADGGTGVTDDLVAGLVVDAAAKLATLVPQRPPTVDAALAYLEAAGDTTATMHLADRGTAAAGLRDDLAGRVAALAAVWPRIGPGWWPRVEEPARVRLAGGAVMVAGRLDLLLGGPPTGRAAVVVEVKGGRWYDGMRADGHLYALLVALRDGRAPRAVVTVVADGTTQVEPVRPAVLVTAAERVEQAIAVAASIAAGEPPATHPGAHCPHCPVLAGCPAGRAWRADDDVAVTA